MVENAEPGGRLKPLPAGWKAQWEALPGREWCGLLRLLLRFGSERAEATELLCDLEQYLQSFSFLLLLLFLFVSFLNELVVEVYVKIWN